MKKMAAVVLAMVMLTGCTGKRDELDRAMKLRAKLLGCEKCTFEAVITADYGDSINSFTLDCQGDNDGNLVFAVAEPETIAGISGRITGGEGELIFDEAALQFPLMADDQLSPVSGPWVFLKTLLGGYLTSCGEEGEFLRVTIDDSYEEDALQLDIWLSSDDFPVRAEILYDGRRIVTMEIKNFEIV